MTLNLYIYEIQKYAGEKSRPDRDQVDAAGTRIPQDANILDAVRHFTGEFHRKSSSQPGNNTQYPESMHEDAQYPESMHKDVHYPESMHEDDMDDMIEILKTEKGRPFLSMNGYTRETDPGIPDISVTDSGIYRMIAVADRRIGIDLQKNVLHSVFNPAEDAARCQKLASRFFHPCESAYVLSSETENQVILRFFRVWTAKEAYVKYTGCGIDGSFSAFSVVGQHWKESDPFADGKKHYTLCHADSGLSCSFIYPNPEMYTAAFAKDTDAKSELPYTLCICTDDLGEAKPPVIAMQKCRCNTPWNFTLLRIRINGKII
ncbi:MAG: 4'-phosphopantetheinyl transferase superfamily protein [Eubacterium sp.]|nr:4'-phosphopantetheinyl transferase superfamily protein [Eubacterium sp.]